MSRTEANGAAPEEPAFERRLGRGDLTAVAEVRGRLRELLAHWGAPGRAYTAELLASELVTNALVHTDGGAVVRAALTGGPGAAAKGLLRVEVRDFVARHPAPRDAGGCGLAGCGATEEASGAGGPQDADAMNAVGTAATSGRGLLLVHSLADDWGVRPHGVGKAVWFELGAQEP
ncbi:ATP-binding protein [Streptomyces sp. ISL-11]|uniref:ATP-binding protein n=1 Tax=Streptomyces sp. ISL-11 TaxID=2819174 RepID=UPI0027E45F37|nr:ATP-binding protein [Streptomyces sp. ISL-11]